MPKSYINSVDVDIIRDLVSDSTNWTEVMMFFRKNYGYKNLCNKTIQKRCIRENIDFSHFTAQRAFHSSYDGYKKSLDELLVKDSNIQSSKLRKRLYESGLLEEKCYKCGLGNIWNGEPITLQLEHINGDHFDNRIQNLTILCPNCHSQTDTFCSKNGKIEYKCDDCNLPLREKRTSGKCITCFRKTQVKPIKAIKTHKQCIDCNEEISKNAERCANCAAIERNKESRKVENRPTLEQLQEDLKELSMVKVGLKYGVSDNCIRKWIKLYSKI